MYRYARGCIKSQRILSEARWHVPLVTKDGFFKTKRKTTVAGGSVIISDKFKQMLGEGITVDIAIRLCGNVDAFVVRDTASEECESVHSCVVISFRDVVFMGFDNGIHRGFLSVDAVIP